MFIERQVPQFINGKWIQQVYAYADETKSDLALDPNDTGVPAREREMTVAQVQAEYPALADKLIGESQGKAPTVSIDVLEFLTDELFDDRAIVLALVKESPLINAILSKPSLNLNKDRINKLILLLQEMEADTNSSLNADVSLKLRTKLAQIRDTLIY